MKKITTIALSAVMAVSMVGDVSAYSFGKVKVKEGTTGTLSVVGDGKADIPIVPWWAPCTMDSEGTSELIFESNGTGYSKRLDKHTITIDVQAISAASLSLEAADFGIRFIDNNTAVIDSGHCSNWDYSISATYGRITSYKQTHRMSYYLRKNGNNDGKVDMTAYWKWGF